MKRTLKWQKQALGSQEKLDVWFLLCFQFGLITYTYCVTVMSDIIAAFFPEQQHSLGHDMSSVQGMNQFGVMNEDVVEGANLGTDNCVMKEEDDFRKGNYGLVFKSDQLEARDSAAGPAPGCKGERRHWN